MLEKEGVREEDHENQHCYENIEVCIAKRKIISFEFQ